MTNVIDDGAVFYLNGQEAFRWNMPAGTVTYPTLSSTVIGTATTQGPFSFPATNLVQGDNVLEMRMAHASGVDLSGGQVTR